MPIFQKVCSKCLNKLSLKRFQKDPKYRLGVKGWCIACCNYRHQTDPRVRMWKSSRVNANKKGLEHTIKVKDIPLPLTCKYLGVLLDYRRASERGSLRHPY